MDEWPRREETVGEPCGGVRSRGPVCLAVQSWQSFLLQIHGLSSAQTAPGFLLSGRKLKLREDTGMLGVTQRARGRRTCDPSLGEVGSVQQGLSRGVQAAFRTRPH